MTAAQPLISLVVAMARNRVIGRDSTLPWRLPADLRRFKAVTMGKPILMGRKTFESIGRPLPGRRNLVLTRDRAWRAAGAEVVSSMDAAVCCAAGVPELAVIGGAEIYRLTLPIADRIHLTRVEAEVQGDTVFPELRPEQWYETLEGTFAADERNQYSMTFLILERKRPASHARGAVT